jgi:hypothetical protein
MPDIIYLPILGYIAHNVLLFMTLPAANRAAGNVAEFLRGNGAAMT